MRRPSGGLAPMLKGAAMIRLVSRGLPVLLAGLLLVAPAGAAERLPVALIDSGGMKILTGAARQDGPMLRVFGLVKPRGRMTDIPAHAHLDVVAFDDRGAIAAERQVRWRGGVGMGRGRHAALYEARLPGFAAATVARIEIRYDPRPHVGEAGR